MWIEHSPSFRIATWTNHDGQPIKKKSCFLPVSCGDHYNILCTYVHMNSSHNTYNLHTIVIDNFSIFHHFQQGYLAINFWTCLVLMTDGSGRSSSWNMVNKATIFLFVIPNKEEGIYTKWKWRMLLSFSIFLTHTKQRFFIYTLWKNADFQKMES